MLGGAVYCNSPYGRQIGKWIRKAYEESRRCTHPIVMLIPERTDTSYFHEYIYGKAEIRFIRGRLKFTDESGQEKDAAPFPSMVVIWRGKRQEDKKDEGHEREISDEKRKRA